jgi:hypothetical protein
MWLQKTDGERAWSALQIDFEPEVRALFSASVQVHIGDGWKALFWVDNWVEGRSISQLAPTLMTIISKRTRKQRTVAQALENRQWIRYIMAGLSIQMIAEYIQLWQLLSSIVLLPG